MGLRLVVHNPTSTWSVGPDPVVYDGERVPAPAILAQGIAHGRVEHHYLEDDGRPVVSVVAVDKPPYVRPTLEEVRAVPWNGLNVVSTFSGCGGSSTGWRAEGYRVLYAVEFIPEAQDTYAANKADYTYLDRRDVREVQAGEILERAGMKPGELDVLEGSPPCESFSSAGRRDKTWGKTVEYCLGPEALILTADLRYVPIGDLAPGDEIMGFEEENEVGRRGRRFCPAHVTNTQRLTRDCLELETADGVKLTSSAEHRWLVVSGSNLRWKTAARLRAGDELLTVGRWAIDQSREAGWLAGMFDGEGCLDRRRRLTVAQRPGPTLDRLREQLAAHGFGYLDHGHIASTARSLEVTTLEAKLRLLGSIRPHRLLAHSSQAWDGLNVGCARKVRLVSVRPLGPREVVGVTTSTGTLIADGLLSHNSGKRQRMDDLFWEYARLLDGLKPRAFVAENVAGLARGKAKGYYKQIVKLLRDCGYVVGARILDAQWLGVPQTRQRLIFVGFRADAGLQPVFPDPLPYRYTVRDALPHIFKIGTAQDFNVYAAAGRDPSTTFVDAGRPNGTVVAGGPHMGNGWVEAERVTHSKYDMDPKPVEGPAPAVMAMDSGHWHVEGKVRHGSFEDYHDKRDVSDRPSPAILSEPGNSHHHEVREGRERRRFTIDELKSICGFPPDYVLTGSYAQQWERLGDSVPPPMMAAVARTVRAALLG